MKSKIKLSGNSKEDIDILFKYCSNINQIYYHIKNNIHLLKFLKDKTSLDLPVMQLLYHYEENLSEVPKCICGENRKYHYNGYRPTCTNKTV